MSKDTRRKLGEMLRELKLPGVQATFSGRTAWSRVASVFPTGSLEALSTRSRRFCRRCSSSTSRT